MSIDYEKVLELLDIPYKISGKNNIAGCFTIQCPCCDDHSMHGNLDPEGGYSCWRCKGSHPTVVLCKASGRPRELVEKILRENSTDTVKMEKKKEYAAELVLPGGNNPLPIQTNYLKKRGFDASQLEFMYNIRYGRPGEKANGIDVSFRIIIPVMDEYGTPIAWQARDTTGKSSLRYVFPRSSECLDDSKNHLYGAHLCRKRNRIVVVEGVFDAWKVGPGCVCTFGTSVTSEQIAKMSQWEEVVLAFDNEPTAQQHAREIAMKLAPTTQVYMIAPNLGYNEDGSARDLGDASIEEIQRFRNICGI